MSICEKTELDTIMCAHCLGHSDEPSLDGLIVQASIAAEFDGNCVMSMEHKIREGETIGLLAEPGKDHHYGWACASCTRRAGDEG